MSFPISVGIIGAGLGDLTSASILQHKAPERFVVTVYEQDATCESRLQGGILDIHSQSGQLALESAGLTDQFKNIVVQGADCMRIVDPNGQVVFDELELQKQHDRSGSDQDSRPEVERTQLRQMLMDSLAPATIQWGKSISYLMETDQGVVSVHLKDGQSTAHHDLVVGADGTWSKVRPFLNTATKPKYSGLTMIQLHLANIDKTHPALSQLCGKGSMFALGNDMGLLTQRSAKGDIRTYVCLRLTSAQIQEFQSFSFEQLKSVILQRFNGWDDCLLDLVRKSSQDDDDAKVVLAAVRPLYSLPIPHQWKSHDKVTLIGDAAHVMVPFAGEGANLAMLDAHDLANALVGFSNNNNNHNQTISNVLEDFEKQMQQRATQSSEESMTNQNLFISPQAPSSVVELMTKLFGFE